MEKRALLAVALSVVVMVTWQLFFAPAPAKPPVPTDAAVPGDAGATSPVGADAEGRPPAGQVPIAATDSPPESSGPAESGAAAVTPIEATAAEEFRLITAAQDIRFTNAGGRATWWRLTRFMVSDDIPVDLIPAGARAVDVLPLQIEIPGDEKSTRKLATALHRHDLSDIPEGDPSGVGPGKRLTFTWADDAGLFVRKTLELPDDGYVGRVQFEVTRNGRPIDATLILASGLSEQSAGDTFRYGHVEGQAVIHDGQAVQRFAPASELGPKIYSTSRGTFVRWAGLESTYFAALVLPPEEPEAIPPELAIAITPRVVPPEPGSDAGPKPLLTAGLHAHGGGSYRLFVGPKDFHLLSGLGHGLDTVIDFSRFSLIYVITRYLFQALTWIHGYVGNYGWSIIILTAIVRVGFFPLMYKSSIKMRQTSKRMSKVQPKVKAIQEKYRKMKKSMETQGKMNEEIMALYKREGINPMSNLGGCLPLLLQMPIFIAFYNLLAVTIELRHAPFIGWIQDLSSHDPYYISPILMGISWLVQQAMTSASIPDPMQRRMMMIMPVMFTFFMINMPSGLVIYWLTSNLLGLAQQYVTNRKADQLDAAAHAQSAAVSRARRAEDGQTA